MLSVCLVALAAWASVPVEARPAAPFGQQPSCPANLLSCSSGIRSSDSCCVETPGGQILQTQFWDYSPSTGPGDSWTIHGLWPDKCDGTYSENCDPSRAYSSIGETLKQNKKSDLVDYMNQFWVDQDGNNEKFWEHEWSTHGTCMSTIAPACLPSNAAKGLDAAYYFQKAVDTFKSLPTYQSLSAAGITPSESKTYSLQQLTDAVKAATGFIPAFDCKGKDINVVTYYFNLKGTIIDGNMVAYDAPKGGSCPKEGIKYLPKRSKGGNDGGDDGKTGHGGKGKGGDDGKTGDDGKGKGNNDGDDGNNGNNGNNDDNGEDGDNDDDNDDDDSVVVVIGWEADISS